MQGWRLPCHGCPVPVIHLWGFWRPLFTCTTCTSCWCASAILLQARPLCRAIGPPPPPPKIRLGHQPPLQPQTDPSRPMTFPAHGSGWHCLPSGCPLDCPPVPPFHPSGHQPCLARVPWPCLYPEPVCGHMIPAIPHASGAGLDRPSTARASGCRPLCPRPIVPLAPIVPSVPLVRQ